jgi:2'-5' RNA ligase
MVRLFIAIDIPELLRDEIADTYRAIPGAKWVDEKQLHCTLRFIGDVPDNTIEQVSASLEQIHTHPYLLTIKGVGFFPPRNIPRILWFGLNPPAEIISMQSKIEKACVNIGLQAEARKFHPHITVARLNNPHQEKIAEFIVSNALFLSEQFEVTHFHLYRSHLGKVQAHYEKLISFALQK